MPAAATAHPARRLSIAIRLVGVIALVAGAAHLRVVPAVPAAAEVVHGAGFAGVVAGWRSWYGSYVMGDLGVAWCIDHGIRAPDPDLGYVHADVDVPPVVSGAMAWALGVHGETADATTAAALMLVLHDLMDARYPAGPLDVDALPTSALAGFGGEEEAILERSRALKADALGHAQLEPPLALTAEATPVVAHDDGLVDVRLTDATGAGVAGVLLHAAVTGAVLTGAVQARTDADGRVRLPFRAAPGENRFLVSGRVPSLALDAFAPTTRPAQRVARPAFVDLAATVVFDAPVMRTMVVRKSGDATAYLPVTGARFDARGPVAATLTVGDDGTATAVLPSGRYEVEEVESPTGYDRAGPWVVDLTEHDETLEVTNRARRGSARVAKVDRVDGAQLAGARFILAYDADADGTYELDVAAVASESSPSVIVDLLPGRYLLTEHQPPEGYVASGPVEFVVEPGGQAEVVVANARLPEPQPTPASPPAPPLVEAAPEAPEVAGAVFVAPAPPAPAPAPAAEVPPAPLVTSPPAPATTTTTARHLPQTGVDLGGLTAAAVAMVAGGTVLTRVTACRRRPRWASRSRR